MDLRPRIGLLNALVRQDRDAVGGCLRVGELEPLWSVSVVEQACTRARHDRVDLQAHLVEQIRVQKRFDERGTPVHADVLAGLLLQLGDRLGEVAADEARAIGRSPWRRFERSASVL